MERLNLPVAVRSGTEKGDDNEEVNRGGGLERRDQPQWQAGP